MFSFLSAILRNHSWKLIQTSPLWNETISCHTNKQEMSQRPAISGSKCEWGLPKPWSSGCYHLPTVVAEEPGACKQQGEQGKRIDPRQLSCIGKEWIQWAQRLACPHTENAKFLNLIPDLRWQCPTSPPGSLDQFSPSYWDAVSGPLSKRRTGKKTLSRIWAQKSFTIKNFTALFTG